MTDEQIKITELTAKTTIGGDSIFPVVEDPSGTPLTKKVSLDTILGAQTGAFVAPDSSARGLVPTVAYAIVPAANFSLSTSTGVQSAFPSTNDVWTLAASTTYLFEGMYFITKSGTTCTTAMAFALGGGASVTSIKYIALAQNVAVNTTGATHGSVWVNQVASTVVNATATTDVYIKFSGIIRMNAGGTVTPQVNFSASPTSPVMVADSFIRFTPIGTNTQNNVGSVA